MRRNVGLLMLGKLIGLAAVLMLIWRAVFLLQKPRHDILYTCVHLRLSQEESILPSLAEVPAGEGRARDVAAQYLWGTTQDDGRYAQNVRRSAFGIASTNARLIDIAALSALPQHRRPPLPAGAPCSNCIMCVICKPDDRPMDRSDVRKRTTLCPAGPPARAPKRSAMLLAVKGETRALQQSTGFFGTT
jgi:hypothetical protein